MVYTPDDHAILSELAVDVVHEIKNPVSLALANVALIRLSDASGGVMVCCDRIEKALKDINTLTVQFLQVIYKNPAPALRTFDMGLALEGVLSEYRAAWPEMTFRLTKPAQPLLHEGDETQMRMAFTNLIKNAVEAAGPRGCVEVTAEPAGSMMRITVRDNGAGMDEATLARVNNGRYTTKPAGSGLGLTICRSALARGGGRLYIANHADGGCEAVAILPLHDGKDSPI